ncbi:hypothetical protein HRG_001878 [Hirsutella rhossiliensis]|uniref:Uncharacterized protein n=1 Tax=Hirsutella rhossiliensis TaxID=111463 RepID=A0A9P8SLP1_9HYPO|nr:uncharacterized protein HRG_01878 [Hirsutella rhossiliensis]KAH0966469.1 hypothetical protein HRG_01878 [Hirsutella rhossiliensis]
MAYYDTIRTQATFSKQASAEEMESFESLYKSDDFDSGVSRWGRKHLFASRVLCSIPQRRLSLFVDGGVFPSSPKGAHPYIDRLINGPEPAFMTMWEPQIVQKCQPDSLGHVWAALAQLLRKQQDSPAMSDRPTRQRVETSQYGDYVSSASIQVGSSPPTRLESASASSESSVGFIDDSSPPPPEDLTVRLASSFVRFVVNYAQPENTLSPPIHFRDQRLTSTYETMVAKRVVQATDDGGLQCYADRRMIQVASLEGKRWFQTFSGDGHPTVSDRTFGQLVGEALALRRTGKAEVISKVE